jgi:hypothetical protein
MTAEMEPTAPGEGVEPLEQLLRVQDLDITLSQLQHRRASLGERRELEAVEAALASLGQQAAALGAQRAALLEKQAEMDEAVAGLTERRRLLEERMYGSRGSAARDLQAMDDEIHNLTQRRAEIEELELAVMEEQEPVDAELARVADERAQLELAAENLRGALAAVEAVVLTEIAEVERARGIEASRLPTALADHYETLRGRLGGVAVARLLGNRCDGCHLELPSVEVDRLRHQPPGTIATCDQCGRILVRVG